MAEMNRTQNTHANLIDDVVAGATLPVADQDDWSIVISSRRSLLDLQLRSLWEYRDLIAVLVRRDFVAFYKQTVLGPLWYVIQPLSVTIVFTVVFNRIVNIQTDGLPPFLFFLSGVTLWNYLSSCISRTSDVFSSNAGIFGKVYFPRLTVPISIVIGSSITFGIQLAVTLCFVVFFILRGSAVHPSFWLAAIPLLALYVAALALGIGILLSSLTTRFRDLSFLVGFGLQLWMYASPIVYPLSSVPQSLDWIVKLNPMTPVVEIFRKAILGSGTVRGDDVVLSLGITMAILFLGLILFSRTSRTSMDTV